MISVSYVINLTAAYNNIHVHACIHIGGLLFSGSKAWLQFCVAGNFYTYAMNHESYQSINTSNQKQDFF